jgi:DNA polymerase-3 subunit gamma/tau
LQEWFNNRALSYQIIITENPGSTQEAEPTLNSREQYLKLIEQYPLVKELKERLKLALDY